MKKKLAGTWKKIYIYWPVQINGNKFATSQILRKPVEVGKGRILAHGAQKSSEPWCVYVCMNEFFYIEGKFEEENIGIWT